MRYLIGMIPVVLLLAVACSGKSSDKKAAEAPKRAKPVMAVPVHLNPVDAKATLDKASQAARQMEQAQKGLQQQLDQTR